MTALLIASQNCHAPAVELLLRAGADPNVSDFDGDTPLMLALANGCTDVVALLERACRVQSAV